MTEEVKNWLTTFKIAMNELKDVKSAGYVKFRIVVKGFPTKCYTLLEVKTANSIYTPNHSLCPEKFIKVPNPVGFHLSINERVKLIGHLLQLGVFDMLSQGQWGIIFNVSRGSIWHYKKQYEEPL